MVRVASTSIRVERGPVDGGARAVPRRPLPIATQSSWRVDMPAPRVSHSSSPAASTAGDRCFDPFPYERGFASAFARSTANDAFLPPRAPGPQNRGVMTF